MQHDNSTSSLSTLHRKIVWLCVSYCSEQHLKHNKSMTIIGVNIADFLDNVFVTATFC